MLSGYKESLYLMKDHQRIIVVLGVRRSGTSALTKGLETMGVSIIDQAHSPFNSFNEKDIGRI